MEKKLSKIVFAVLILFLPAISYGQLVTIAISGYVTDIGDENGHFGGQIQVNDLISGTYTYDSETSDLYPADLTYAKYLNYNELTGISLYVSGFNFRTNPSNVEVGITIRNNNLGEDRYTFASSHNLSLSDNTLVQGIGWILSDSTGTALASDLLPSTAPDLNKWNSNTLIISTDRDFTISATVTSATLIPEPTSILLFGMSMMLARKHFSK